MLEIDTLVVKYGNLQIIQNVSMRVDAGEMLSLVGSNGAGKTTLLKSLSGLIKVASGAIRFEGEDITNLRPDEIVARGIAQVPEGRKLFPHMTVLENLELGSYTKAAKRKRKESLEHVFSILPDLVAKANFPAGALSGGQQQMVAIGRGLMALPKLMILDEPSIGLSPLLTETMFGIIETVKKSGVTVLLVEQNVQYALSIADRAYVMEQGRVMMEGPAAELLANDGLRKSYLGL
jgi:branched-chain amino acid transport system ATP-binding protein